MSAMDRDKRAELERYDTRAQAQLATGEPAPAGGFGAAAMRAYLRAPYLHYEASIARLVLPQHRVLELGAGAGLHTLGLAKTGADVTATDISPHALALLQQRLHGVGLHVGTQVADMESLPFGDASFDVVACAGCLSYGDPALVDAEIGRVLRPGGAFICVDSLNHNPIYRLNRLIHCYRGERTQNTLARMPDAGRIQRISHHFSTTETRYFGALTFAMPVLARIVRDQRAQSFSDWFDRVAKVERSAFKFVLVGKNLVKP